MTSIEVFPTPEQELVLEYMAEYADKEHLTEYVQRAANQSGGNK